MNARQLLTKMEGLRKEYLDSLGREEDLSLELSMIVEGVYKMNGSSFIEPDFRGGAAIYRELYTKLTDDSIATARELDLPRAIG